jgi:valyl-tRNA synthetase
MDTKFHPSHVESILYKFWEENNYFVNQKGVPFTILMPPPNANASLHAGHGMYTVDDIMIRWKILKGYNACWIPGLDHAGFETQYVYEKNIAKQGKSRMDFDRQTLYENIYDFVKENSGLIYKQFKQLGFAADWSRSVFSLDSNVINYVYETFKQLHDDNLVYRSDYIVNYCVHCGTSLSELEVKHVERIDPLYFIKYGPFVLATVRPETKFGDTAVAVHPDDKRYKKWIGKEIEVEGLLGKFRLKVISDEYVDPKFGTGVVKITPAHDPNDFLIGKRHNLEIKQVIDLNGRLTEITELYKGMKVKAAREKVVTDLKAKNLLVKIDNNYKHAVTVCYKCGRDLEPSIIPNWFIKVTDLKKPVISAIEQNKVKFYPPRFKKQILQWLSIMHDWPISRQIAWGIRIPVWYSITDNSELHIVFLDKNRKMQSGIVRDLIKKYSLEELEKGLQKLTAPRDAVYQISKTKPGDDFLRETDTFDTWFSSGQWPLVTSRFPTDVLGTLSDILPFWVSRMIMFSLYRRNDIPFKNVCLWSMVADAKGVKMSKSKGNVVNPLDYVNKHGADALRASLLFGTSQGGKVILSEDKVIGMRNFANKIWNVGRFIEMNQNQNAKIKNPAFAKATAGKQNPISVTLLKELENEKKQYEKYMKSYHFSKALELIYEFLWHRFADYYIEQLKEDLKNGNIEVLDLLKKVYFDNLKMLHPFMPFVTEAVWQVFHGKESSILKTTN